MPDAGHGLALLAMVAKDFFSDARSAVPRDLRGQCCCRSAATAAATLASSPVASHLSAHRSSVVWILSSLDASLAPRTKPPVRWTILCSDALVTIAQSCSRHLGRKTRRSKPGCCSVRWSTPSRQLSLWTYGDERQSAPHRLATGSRRFTSSATRTQSYSSGTSMARSANSIPKPGLSPSASLPLSGSCSPTKRLPNTGWMDRPSGLAATYSQ